MAKGNEGEGPFALTSPRASAFSSWTSSLLPSVLCFYFSSCLSPPFNLRSSAALFFSFSPSLRCQNNCGENIFVSFMESGISVYFISWVYLLLLMDCMFLLSFIQSHLSIFLRYLILSKFHIYFMEFRLPSFMKFILRNAI